MLCDIPVMHTTLIQQSYLRRNVSEVLVGYMWKVCYTNKNCFFLGSFKVCGSISRQIILKVKDAT